MHFARKLKEFGIFQHFRTYLRNSDKILSNSEQDNEFFSKMSNFCKISNWICRKMRKNFADFFLKYWGPSGVKACQSYSDFSAKWSNSIGLVLFCIDAKFCKKIFVGKLLMRSTRCSSFCTAQTSIFQQNFVKLSRIFRQNFEKFWCFRVILIEFCSEFHENLSEFRRIF